MIRQLSFEFNIDLSFDNFYFSQENLSLKNYLLGWIEPFQKGDDLFSTLEKSHYPTQALYLFAESGLGVSHILHAVCSYASDIGLRSMYCNADNLMESDETYDLDIVCVDDVDYFSSGKKGRMGENFFHRYNHWQDKGVKIIMGAHAYPSELRNILPDLRSRFAKALQIKITPPEEHELEEMLYFYLNNIGWNSSDLVVKDLMTYFSRDASEILKFIRNIDDYLSYKGVCGNLSYFRFRQALSTALIIKKKDTNIS